MEFTSVMRAYRRTVKGKKKSSDYIRFGQRLGENLIQLHHELTSKTYKPGQTRCFVVIHPRPREIWAAPFRDRIVHHLIVEPLEKIWASKLHPKSFACRRGKGQLAALLDFQKQVRRLSQGGQKPVWALQVDIESFFYTIDRRILLEKFLSRAKDPELRSLIETQFSIDPRHHYRRTGNPYLVQFLPPEKSWLSKGPNQGIPIGNLTSQFGANLYLNELDHMITRNLKPGGYLRYMDDLLLLDTDPDKLKPLDAVIDQWLRTERNQNLNPTKTKLKPLHQGIEYLGMELKQVNDPKEPLRIHVPPDKKWKLVNEARRLTQLNWWRTTDHHALSLPLGHKNRHELQKINSRLGLMGHADSYKFRRQVAHKLLLNWGIGNEDLKEMGIDFAPIRNSKDFLSLKLNT